eukprot:767283-Hanusia_phi.AAC.4
MIRGPSSLAGLKLAPLLGLEREKSGGSRIAPDGRKDHDQSCKPSSQLPACQVNRRCKAGCG